MKFIFLSNGKRAFIDDEDWARFAKHNWHHHGLGYVFYWRKMGEKNYPVLMHREVMNPAPDEDVHHRDGNRLNNQRQNLQVMTKSEHTAEHQRLQGPRKGKYKGVCYLRDRRKWLAQIGRAKGTKWLGEYRSEEAAARAYDQAAFSTWGDKAYLNFPCLRPLYVKLAAMQQLALEEAKNQSIER